MKVQFVSCGSEFRSCTKLHDWLHVSVIELWNFTLVEFRLFGSIKLVLVNISILVSDRGWIVTFWEELDEADHLRPQVDQSLLVGRLEKFV